MAVIDPVEATDLLGDPPVAEPPISASLLGQQLGLNPMETNMLLVDEGILEGKPNAYSLTDKGREYANEKYVETSHNQGHVVTTYDPSIKDSLDVTPERRRELQQRVSDHLKQKRAETRAAADDYAAEQQAAATRLKRSGVDGRTVVVYGVVVAAVVSAGYGAWKLYPRLKRRWQDRRRTAESAAED